jgi:hypothetical protein
MNLNRLIILIFLTIFSLQSLTKANDISEFQIEGISIGDSLLDYYTLKNIKSKKKLFYPKSKKHYLIEFTDNLVKYDSIGIHVKENDNDYKITSIKGVIFFDKKLKKCKKKMKQIEKDVSNFLNIEKRLYEEKNYPDDRGKGYIIEFHLSNDRLRIWCVDFFKKAEKLGRVDNLAISIEPHDFSKWLKNEAW